VIHLRKIRGLRGLPEGARVRVFDIHGEIPLVDANGNSLEQPLTAPAHELAIAPHRYVEFDAYWPGGSRLSARAANVVDLQRRAELAAALPAMLALASESPDSVEIVTTSTDTAFAASVLCIPSNPQFFSTADALFGSAVRVTVNGFGIDDEGEPYWDLQNPDDDQGVYVFLDPASLILSVNALSVA
jgi:hypothetical protein